MKAPATTLQWRPGATLATARLRAGMLHAARRFFMEHGVLEVETPALSPAAVSDPNIESVAVRLAADAQRPYYLHTSPELAMKRLLCDGWPDIFQICRVFRDGEVGDRHQPEFTMVEWYRRDISLDGMIQHTVQFVTELLDANKLNGAAVHLSYRDAFRQHAGIDPLAAGVSELRQASGADAALSQALGEDRDQWLDLLLTERVAPCFDRQRLTVLHHYPASQAALARNCPDDSRLADRFELFLGELELANGYYELRDADEQRRRCASDQQQRTVHGKAVRPLDEKFLAALDSGLPSCCGVAVGFDRLVMIRAGTGRLRDVQTFATVDT